MIASALACLTLMFAPEAPSTDDAHWRRVVQRFADGKAKLDEVTAGGEHVLPILLELALDREVAPILRGQYAHMLGLIGSSSAVEPLITLLSEEPWHLRSNAALALGEIGDERARKPLEELAERDPFARKDPRTNTTTYSVRESARRALASLDAGGGRLSKRIEPEEFLEDASRLPESPMRRRLRRHPWPFPGGVADQNIYNNYQQPTDSYVHAALDLLQEAGTEARAVASGVVATIASNYPDDEHHFFIVEPAEGAGEGWCYTHLDPATFTFEVGDRIRTGDVLGRVVEFSGVDHLHLHYVRFEELDGTVEVESLFDPLACFDVRDERSPVVYAPFFFVEAGTLNELPKDDDGVPVIRGAVDVLAGISDDAHADHVANWMVPVVTIEIRGEESAPWRKLVLDQRGRIGEVRAARALYLTYKERQALPWSVPANPVVHVVKATHTDGDGVLEEADAWQAWRTDQKTVDGKARFPNGVYEVIVRAWDLAGNTAEGRTRVRVANP